MNTPKKKIQEIKNQLKQVLDPELKVNIVDLGLVYNIAYDLAQRKVHIQMTLTTIGCPLGPMIEKEVKEKLKDIEGIKEIEVELVWEPAWNQNMITEEGKQQLKFGW
ncbi:MAG: hypothetical protein A3B74_05115 [Candidatus Kerfeldbacteria bacterium RIFCSPHIGHO2_02_FULL_42_14]|uniref:MIP18 family-like domain-containing protein n=1 Tax=Candidatus Kerfeldbacteria bacterium RIFCSPHIGHO2_02_FULL_42_14 TaxID=1798540 RepID=A0A1G2AVM2_9BACT|nr:MAG: hypothetical protein A3B74_05115 [Candidatus Kerfeldbacteria bacterium RIFCSPHIGHO2_02_FULL_42_14]OGY81624.1 MAG: hypothetical protein A3E60_02140 [Candidatus Kerfeldbacteria bacterium RIFCSPHIGHO2_12_FULL_42_13]OGY83226.1 MAG: hypothetical protein A3I91_03545 [Candidatus Kerfeldbacteria bacterium RIFCSPLOWO2_02_FULL_42_19]OGY85531.1 MAG: hypothetical protein A3G01_01535 [Candidatus Kerfeldbacteria bacterium RIFCSPLOWO2_12_FULL_43_9]